MKLNYKIKTKKFRLCGFFRFKKPKNLGLSTPFSIPADTAYYKRFYLLTYYCYLLHTRLTYLVISLLTHAVDTKCTYLVQC